MRNITALFTCSLLLLTSSAALPQRWDVDLSAQPPQVFALQRPRGETYELEVVLKNHGKPFAPAITNACIYWQTNGMENLYWSAPASVSNNVLRASWLPSMDPGATTVRGYIGDPGHIYAAAFQFRFISSPGALPNELPLPQKVIDFAKVTVLNPPWSGGGGGGGVDTNAVIDIIHKTVDGSARTLPPYLHYLEMDDTYPEAAAEWYAQADYSHGSCSARRTCNLLERNYDWNFDFMPEFVIRVPAGFQTLTTDNQQLTTRRYASIAVCNVGTNLIEADVVSGKHLRWLKALPGHAVDGINSEGVVAEVNVVGGDPHEAGWPTNGTIHCLGAVRWVLDHATNAASAASVLASEVYFPSGFGQNFHWMIADATSTYIVENGAVHSVGGDVPGAPPAVLTNFRLYPTRDTTGEGQERYDALASGASITSQWWTLTYTPDGYRASDLQGLDTNLLFRTWAATPKESHRGETFPTSPSSFASSWWQTVHTSIYDITNRTLRISVQEQDDWYVFAVPSAGGVKPEAVKEIVEPMIVDATNGLRRVDNFEVRGERFSEWTTDADISPYSIMWEESPGGSGWGLKIFEFDMPQSTIKGDRDSLSLHWELGESAVGRSFTASRTKSMGVIDRIATTNEIAQAVKENEKDGTYNQIVRGRYYDGVYEINVTSARDASLVSWGGVYNHPTTLSGYGITNAIEKVNPNYPKFGVGWDVNIGYFTIGLFKFGDDHVLYRGLDLDAYFGAKQDVLPYPTNAIPTLAIDGLVQKIHDEAPAPGDYAAVSNAAIYASNTVANIHIDATDPAFSNAVLAVQVDTNTVAQIGELKQFFDGLPTGTVVTSLGGIIFALLGAAAYLKKKTALLETDGKASNDFATDLLGKQVAITAVQNIVNGMFDNGDTTAYPRTTGEG